MREQIGAVVYRRLRPALRQEKMVVLGSAPWIRDYEQIWNGFIAAAREDKWKVNFIYEDQDLRPIKDFSGLQRKTLSWPDLEPDSIKEIKNHLQFGHLILIHTTFNHSSHRGETSLSRQLESRLNGPWTAISMLGFAVNEEEGALLQPPCEDPMSPATRGDYVACAANRISRRYYRKRLDPMAYWAAMDLHGLKDYFLYIHEPPTAHSP